MRVVYFEKKNEKNNKSSAVFRSYSSPLDVDGYLSAIVLIKKACVQESSGKNENNTAWNALTEQETGRRCLYCFIADCYECNVSAIDGLHEMK